MLNLFSLVSPRYKASSPWKLTGKKVFLTCPMQWGWFPALLPFRMRAHKKGDESIKEGRLFPLVLFRAMTALSLSFYPQKQHSLRLYICCKRINGFACLYWAPHFTSCLLRCLGWSSQRCPAFAEAKWLCWKSRAKHSNTLCVLQLPRAIIFHSSINAKRKWKPYFLK